MRMMGTGSVDYHRSTVLNRSDDHPGQALAYYASRGETPLVWGGAGARDLGLVGNVTDAQYEAIDGPGGAVDPTTGERLVSTRRPGMELVIAARKSVAELGVIGRAEHMHKIMDAERDATLAYLDALTAHQGGRRGRACMSSPTEGLIYAVTRHATSRAGDPAPHDHVLLANVVRMADEKGGWKAATTSLWREHVHAATMFGRVAAAREAVNLGYGIERDDGPSGRLGHWAIAGIPAEVMEVHSKRTAEIAAEAQRRGYDSYRAKGIIARDIRAAKRQVPVGELVPRWQAELESVGWPVERLDRSVAEARTPRRRSVLTAAQEREVVAKALAADGPLATRKVFSRRDVVVAVAPALFGLEPAELPRVVSRTLADPETVPLLPTAFARGRAYATATTIATESSIAAAVDIEVRRTNAPAVDEFAARLALARREQELGTSLTLGQRGAVMGITTSGRGTELVVGVGGSGKTTALAAVRDAFESEGFTVIGTSTSGQAARTLRRQAGIEESRTLASLTWRLDHGQLTLTDRHVVILDEAAMSEDRALLAVLSAAASARAKVVLVGDHRQLGAVGPGGGFESLVNRYGAGVHVLADNVRQRNVAERAALADLRDGDVAKAAAWYARNGRIVVARDHSKAIDAVVAGWAGDVADGHETAMYAWRRADVAELNHRARDAWREQGRLHGPELVAPGGAVYAAGDRVVTLAPGAGGKVVTSETGIVVTVDPKAKTLTMRTDDGHELHILKEKEIGADRLAHGYAVTVHRSQGATVERAHALEDGGGRELAYVKMSRAKDRSTVYVVADDVEQAVEDLSRDWSAERRPAWAIDSGTPVSNARAVENQNRVALPMRSALRRARLAAEVAAISAVMPPDPAAELQAAERERSRLERQRQDLANGAGRYRGTPVAEAMRELQRIDANMQRLERNLKNRSGTRKDRRDWRGELEGWRQRHAAATTDVQSLVRPERTRLRETEQKLDRHIGGLRDQQENRRAWDERHPEAVRRIEQMTTEIERLDAGLARARLAGDRPLGREGPLSRYRPPPTLERGMDLGR
ncbi:MAG: MobF family relaxase [Acidimicrobiales bacterium]